MLRAGEVGYHRTTFSSRFVGVACCAVWPSSTTVYWSDLKAISLVKQVSLCQNLIVRRSPMMLMARASLSVAALYPMR